MNRRIFLLVPWLLLANLSACSDSAVAPTLTFGSAGTADGGSDALAGSDTAGDSAAFDTSDAATPAADTTLDDSSGSDAGADSNPPADVAPTDTAPADALVADSALADADLLDSVPADAAVADAAVPDVTTPDSAAPDTAVPDTAAPDTTVPDTAAPDIAPPTDTKPGTVCGNGTCEPGESTSNCQADCKGGSNTWTCGDGACDIGEQIYCAKDCKIDPATCVKDQCPAELAACLTNTVCTQVWVCAQKCTSNSCVQGCVPFGTTVDPTLLAIYNCAQKHTCL